MKCLGTTSVLALAVLLSACGQDTQDSNQIAAMSVDTSSVCDRECILDVTESYLAADGLLHEIEALGFSAPFESETGWE